MKIFDFEQRSLAWYDARRGVVTASDADLLVSPLGKVRTGQGVETYLHLKLAEKLINYCPQQLEVFSVDQGKIIETIAIPWFEFTHNKKVKRVGFCLSDDGRCGCSPDGILEDGSGLEIKSPQAPAQIKYLLGGCVPDDYILQCQFSLYVTQAPYWTFVSYNMRLPALVVRVERDERIQAAIGEAVEKFLTQFDFCMAKIKAMEGGK